MVVGQAETGRVVTAAALIMIFRRLMFKPLFPRGLAAFAPLLLPAMSAAPGGRVNAYAG